MQLALSHSNALPTKWALHEGTQKSGKQENYLHPNIMFPSLPVCADDLDFIFPSR